jgi:hypothetical protein
LLKIDYIKGHTGSNEIRGAWQGGRGADNAANTKDLLDSRSFVDLRFTTRIHQVLRSSKAGLSTGGGGGEELVKGKNSRWLGRPGGFFSLP